MAGYLTAGCTQELPAGNWRLDQIITWRYLQRTERLDNVSVYSAVAVSSAIASFRRHRGSPVSVCEPPQDGSSHAKNSGDDP